MIDRQSLAVAYDDKDRDKNKSNVIPFIFKKPFLQEIEEMDK